MLHTYFFDTSTRTGLVRLARCRWKRRSVPVSGDFLGRCEKKETNPGSVVESMSAFSRSGPETGRRIRTRCLLVLFSPAVHDRRVMRCTTRRVTARHACLAPGSCHSRHLFSTFMFSARFLEMRPCSRSLLPWSISAGL